MSALAQAREKARSINCTSNLKQLGLGCLMYADDNEETIPRHCASGAPEPSWQQQIFKYVGAKNVYLCPTNALGWDKENRYCGGYSMNLSYNGGWIGAGCNNLSRIKRPSSLGMIMDGRDGTAAALWVGYWYRNTSTGDPSYVHATGRHSRGSNVCFADGHVERIGELQLMQTRSIWDMNY